MMNHGMNIKDGTLCITLPDKTEIERVEVNGKMYVADEKLRILADVLDGCPLSEPCDKMWEPDGWCMRHCKDGQDAPDTECWLRYAEVMTSE